MSDVSTRQPQYRLRRHTGSSRLSGRSATSSHVSMKTTLSIQRGAKNIWWRSLFLSPWRFPGTAHTWCSAWRAINYCNRLSRQHFAPFLALDCSRRSPALADASRFVRSALEPSYRHIAGESLSTSILSRTHRVLTAKWTQELFRYFKTSVLPGAGNGGAEPATRCTFSSAADTNSADLAARSGAFVSDRGCV
jgi:hypothetical protein